MFNMNKDKSVKEEVANLVATTEVNVADIASNVKNATTNLQSKTKATIKESKGDALELINNLKELLTETNYTSKVQDMKEQVLNKTDEWKHVVKAEVARALDASTAQTKKAVCEQPLLTIGVAIGAGLLIGYLLGNKESSK